MNLHKHARLSPRGRALLVDRILVQGLRAEEAAHAAGVSVRTAYKWLKRFSQEGPDGLLDRSSRPHHCPHATPQAVVDRVFEQRPTCAPDLSPDRRTVAGGAEHDCPPAAARWFAPAGRVGARTADQPLRIRPARPVAAFGYQETGALPPARPSRYRQSSDQLSRRRLGVCPSGHRRPLARGLCLLDRPEFCRHSVAALRVAPFKLYR